MHGILLQGAPSISLDLSGLAKAITDTLTGWFGGVTDNFGNQSKDLLHQALQQFQLSGLNFMGGTPAALVTAGADAFGPTALRPVLSDAVNLCIVLAGVSYVGRYWFGWPGLGESVSRICVTIIIVSSSFKLMNQSIEFVGYLTGHITNRPPQLPDLTTTNPLIVFGAGVIWFVLAMRLAVQMGKRLVFLAVLYKLAPIALATYMHSKSAWIGTLWTKLWVGWLFGVVPVVVCFVASIDIISAVGLPAGYLISLATLLAAYDLVKILAPSEGIGGIGVSFGYGPFRASL